MVFLSETGGTQLGLFLQVIPLPPLAVWLYCSRYSTSMPALSGVFSTLAAQATFQSGCWSTEQVTHRLHKGHCFPPQNQQQIQQGSLSFLICVAWISHAVAWLAASSLLPLKDCRGSEENNRMMKKWGFPLSQGTYSFLGVKIEKSMDHKALRSHVSHMY